MTGIMAVSGGLLTTSGGGGGALDNEIVFVQDYFFPDPPVMIRGYLRGYMGSITDGIFAPLSGTAISALYWDSLAGHIYFMVDGAYSNTGWTSIKIGSATYNRTSGSFSSSSFGTSWRFDGVGIDPWPSTNTTVEFN